MTGVLVPIRLPSHVKALHHLGGGHLKIMIAFLLVDAILVCLLWLLLADDFAAAEHDMLQAENERDRAIDDWFRAQDYP